VKARLTTAVHALTCLCQGSESTFNDSCAHANLCQESESTFNDSCAHANLSLSGEWNYV